MLAGLVKTLWTTELVPGPWRSGDIVNIFKKGDKKDPGNYRGITLLNVMGRLYTKVIDSRFQPALPLPEASQQPPLPADLRPVLVMDWDPTRPWHPRHMGPQARAGDADAVPAQPQPQPQLAISPHLVGAWSAGVIDPRSWASAASLPTSMSSGRGPAACARCDASLQACQTRSAPCGQPSGQQSTVMSTAASVALSLVGQQHGIIASSSSPRRVPRVLLASEEHQTHPLTLRGCIALSLVQLLFETDAHRSRSLRHQLSQRSLRRDSACVPPYAVMILTLLL